METKYNWNKKIQSQVDICDDKDKRIIVSAITKKPTNQITGNEVWVLQKFLIIYARFGL